MKCQECNSKLEQVASWKDPQKGQHQLYHCCTCDYYLINPIGVLAHSGKVCWTCLHWGSPDAQRLRKQYRICRLSDLRTSRLCSCGKWREVGPHNIRAELTSVDLGHLTFEQCEQIYGDDDEAT